MTEEIEGYAKQMMQLYDLATELAPKEGKTHRETFDLICQYLEVESKIDKQKKILLGKRKEIDELTKQIRERKGTLAILKTIQQGKMGQG